VDRLTYVLDISPASGNKSVSIGIVVAVAATEDPWCAVVAQASFEARQCVFLVERGSIGVCVRRVLCRGNRSDP
jgi:hypothetical protein